MKNFLAETTNMASTNSAAQKEEEQRKQRSAEREGRRTRRRRGKQFDKIQYMQKITNFPYLDRERKETPNLDHLVGMSSDDEIPDHESTFYKNQLSEYDFHYMTFYKRIDLKGILFLIIT